ncbi:MAG: hypothetical protein OEY56_03660 [Cyclobacteriaceae bacterium]|nr:hypothetical protein [Cyclobacteriaceae bacterium]
MTKNNRILNVGVFLGIWLLAGCTYYEIPPKPVEIPDSVSFQLDVQPIFTANCSVPGCHVAGNLPPNLSEGSAWVNLVYFNYVDTTNVDNSILLSKLTVGTMAKFASEQDVAIIKQWIIQGAPDN